MRHTIVWHVLNMLNYLLLKIKEPMTVNAIAGNFHQLGKANDEIMITASSITKIFIISPK